MSPRVTLDALEKRQNSFLEREFEPRYVGRPYSDLFTGVWTETEVWCTGHIIMLPLCHIPSVRRTQERCYVDKEMQGIRQNLGDVLKRE